jgi:predicted permease
LILSALFKISLPILLGYGLKTLGYFSEEHTASVRLFCVRVAIPALVFMNLYTSDLSTVQQFLPVSLSAFIFTGITWVSIVGLTRLFSVKKHRIEIILVTIFSNVGYIGWAVLDTLLGDGGLRRGIFVSSFWWPNMYLYSFLTIMVCGGGGSLKGEGHTILMNIIPPLSAVFLGLILNLGGVNVPGDLQSFFSSFAVMTVPLILFTVGMSISVRDSISDLKRLLPLTFLRTALSLGAMMLTILILPMLDELSRKSLIIDAFMPVAAGNLIMAHVFNLDSRFISSAIALSTLVSFAVIPIMVGVFAA